MRIARARIEQQIRIISNPGDGWHDISDGLASLHPPVRSISTLVESGRLATTLLRGLCEVQPVAPEPAAFELPLIPSKIVCLGRNYSEHARELGNEEPDEPVLFNKTPNTYLADRGTVSFDPAVGRVDHEGEIALVMGPGATVAGYTLLNDITAREMQSADKAKGLPWYRAKNLDTFCPFGPCIRVADSLPENRQLALELRVNGELRQRGDTGQFIFDIPTMLKYISRYITLIPGDLVATGTPQGVGALQNGDMIELISPEIGALRSQVRAQSSTERSS